ncbi:MAG TPA: hypothetical protein VF807_00195 [Ktedonobacterales bacterium]
MMTAKADLLASLRAGSSAREAALALLATDQPRRSAITWLLAGTLAPGDAPIARALLAQETADIQRSRAASEALYTLVAIVARYADPADVLLLWRAREANEETREGVDIEQVARLGLGAVRATLARLAAGTDATASEARAAQAWLVEGQAAGAFDDLPGYFAWSDERFGLVITAPT